MPDPAQPPRRRTAAAASAPVTPAELVRYRTYGILVDTDLSSAATARRVRRIRRLRRDLGLSYDAIALVERLVERIEELEAEQGRTTRGESWVHVD
jgi:hypothetical protein